MSERPSTLIEREVASALTLRGYARATPLRECTAGASRLVRVTTTMLVC